MYKYLGPCIGCGYDSMLSLIITFMPISVPCVFKYDYALQSIYKQQLKQYQQVSTTISCYYSNGTSCTYETDCRNNMPSAQSCPTPTVSSPGSHGAKTHNIPRHICKIIPIQLQRKTNTIRISLHEETQDMMIADIVYCHRMVPQV